MKRTLAQIISVAMLAMTPLGICSAQEDADAPSDIQNVGSAEGRPPDRDSTGPVGDRGERDPRVRPPRGGDGIRLHGPPHLPRGDGRPPFGPGDGRPGYRPDGIPRPEGPRRVESHYRDLHDDPSHLEHLKKFDLEMYEVEIADRNLERQTFELSQQYRRAPRDQRETLKKQLEELVQKHFDARQARRQLQLNRLAEELNRMRSSMNKRAEARNEIVTKRVSELIGESSDLDF